MNTMRRSRNLAMIGLGIGLGLVLVAGCLGHTTQALSTGGTPHSTPATKTVTDRDKGTTVTLHVGDHLKVVLASTYWTLHPSSNAGVLHADGRPVIRPRPSGCVPGQGCGTATESFTATARGTATVTAGRTTCGEALQCSGTQGAYKITVVVK